MPSLSLRITFIMMLLPWQFLSGQVTFQKTLGGAVVDVAFDVQPTSDGGCIIGGDALNAAGGGSDAALLVKTDADGNIVWKKAYSIGGNEHFRIVRQTPDGGYLCAGRIYDSPGFGEWDFLLIRTDSDGDILWSKNYGGSARDLLWSAELTSDTGMIMVGYTESFGAGSYDGYVVKVNSSGVIQWTKTIGGGAQEEAIDVQETPEGDYIVAGYALSYGAGDADYLLLKISASGNIKWSKALGNSSWEHANAVALAQGGGYVVAGRSNVSGTVYHFGLVRTDTSGNILWHKTYGDSNDDIPYKVYPTSDGGYILCGVRGNNPAILVDAFLVKTDASGNLEWSRAFGGSAFDGFNSIIQTADGGFLAVGNTNSFGNGSSDLYIVKMDSVGNSGCNQLSTNTSVSSLSFSVNSGGVFSTGGNQNSLTYTDAFACIEEIVLCGTSGPGYTSSSQTKFQKYFDGIEAVYVEQTTDNGYIITGGTATYGAGANDRWLAKTTSSGNIQWAKTYGAAGNDWSNTVRQTSDGGFILGGTTESSGAGMEDVYMIKTDQNGSEQWSKTYGGSNIDRSAHSQQTADGGYIITGTTKSFGAGNWDVYLLKIDAIGTLQWSKTFGESGEDEGWSVQQTSDGGYIISGRTNSFGTTNDKIYLIKTDGSGNLSWSKYYGGISADYGYTFSVQTDDGGYVVTGWTTSFGAGQDDILLFKTDASGNAQWAKTYGGTDFDRSLEVRQTLDGGYIITGSTVAAGNQDAVLIKTDCSGDTLWTRKYGGAGNDAASSAQQAADGGYIVTGLEMSFGNTSVEGTLLIKTDINGFSGCNESTTSFTVSSPSLLSASPSTVVGTGGVSNNPATIENCLEITDGVLCGSGTTYQKLSSTISKTDVSCTGCNDGSINLTVAGGSGSYSFAWSSGQTTEDIYNLYPGTFIVTVTDNYGCSISDTAIIGGSLLTFQKTFGGTNYETSSYIEPTSDGGYIVAGRTLSYGLGDDALLIKLDAYGNIEWMRTYGGTDSESFRVVKQTPDGGYLAAGTTLSFGFNGSLDLYLLKTNGQGNLIWSKTYGGNDVDNIGSAELTSDGGIILSGYTKSYGAGDNDIYLLRVDSVGTVMWSKTIGTASDDQGYGVRETSDGGFIVATIYSASNAALIKTDANGNLQWEKTYSAIFQGIEVVQTSDGGYMATGVSHAPFEVFLMKTDSSGNPLWMKTFGEANPDYGASIKKTFDGGFIICGQRGNISPEDGYLIKTDSNGNPQWIRVYGMSGREYFNSVSPTLDGGYIMNGFTTSFGAGDFDIYVVKTDNLGNSVCNQLTPNTMVTSPANSEGTPSSTIGSGVMTGNPAVVENCVEMIDGVLCSNSASVITYQKLSTSISKTDVTCTGCNDGSINLSVNGGSGSYSFAWSSGQTTEDLSNLYPGTYIVAVSDNYGCSIADTAVVGGTLLAFQKVYKTDDVERFSDVAPTADGGYILAGNYSNAAYTENLALLVKTDVFGNTVWQKTYGENREERFDFISEITGGYVGAGKIYAPGGLATNPDFYLIKTNLQGDLLWSKTYGGAGNDVFSKASFTTDGGMIMVGNTNSFGAGGRDVYLVKVDSSGNQQWTKTFGGSGDDNGADVIQTNDGGFAIVGTDGNSQLYLIKTDANGNLSWSRSCNTLGTSGVALIQTVDNGYAITGTMFNPGQDILILKTDASGTVQWAKSHAASGGPDYVSSIELASDGGYIISGQRGLGTNEDFYLIKTDASGNIEWTKAHGGLDEDEIHSVKLTADGGFICAGQTRSFGTGSVDAFMMKTDAQGNSGCNLLSSVTTVSNITFTVSTPANATGTGGTPSVSPATATCALQLDSVLCSNSSSSVEHPLLSTSISKTDVSCAGCNNGYINLTVNGGSGSYAYNWSTMQTTEDLSNLSSGLYIVTVTDNYGCWVIDSATISAPAIMFQKVIGTASLDYCWDIKQTSDNGFILAGLSRDPVSDGALLVKTDANGTTAWSKTYNAGEVDATFFYVAQMPDGGYMAAGKSGKSNISPDNEQIYIVRTDAQGDQIWSRTIGGNGNEHARHAQVTTDGGIITVGYSDGFGAGGKDFYVVKVDANGNLEWEKTFGGSGEEFANTIVQTVGGAYIVGGSTEGSGFGSGSGDGYIVKINAGGNSVWIKTIGTSEAESISKIKITPDGDLIILGNKWTPSVSGSQDYFLARTDSNANVVWSKTYGISGISDYAEALNLTSDGGYVFGGSKGFVSPHDVWLLKTDSNGNLLWSESVGGTAVEEIYSIAITIDGGYACTGLTNSFGFGDTDGYFLKTNPNGVSGCNSVSHSTTVASLTLTTASTSTSVGSGGTANSLISSADCSQVRDSSLCSNVSGSSFLIWVGNTTDWFTETNWNPNVVPNSSSNVLISSGTPVPFIPSVGGSIVAEANHFTIQSGAGLNIGGELEIYGNLNNNGTISGSGKLHFKNPCNNQYLTGSSTFFNGIVKVAGGSTLHTNNKLFLEPGSSLLHGSGTPGGEGDVIGNISYKQLGQTNPIKWNYWSSPVTGANVSILGSRLYYFDVDSAIGTSLDDIREGWMDASGLMQPGIGYISQGGGTVSFAGPPGNAPTGAPVTVSVTKNAVTTVGYNFLGNPFPSAISAQAFVDSNIGTMYGSIYLWDDDATGGSGYQFNDFVVWNGAGAIGPNSGKPFNGQIATAQGFFAEKIANGNGSVIFTNSMRTTQNDAFFRLAPIERLWMNIIGPDSAYNETLIAFLDDATDSMDIRYDAKKFFGEQNIAFYSLLDGKSCAIQSFPPLENNRTVQLGVNAGADGDYIINLKKVETLDETVVILLEDTLTGNMYNLRVDSSHTFHVAKGNDNGRFLLHFNPQMLISTQQEGCAGNDGQIFIEQPGNYDWDFVLKDESGFVVDSVKNFNGSALYSGLEGGRYVLMLDDRYGYSVTKYIELDAKEKVTAGFEISNLVFHAGDSITIHNTSVGALQYEWSFGDSVTSYAEHPTHVYSFPGVYPISLNASNSDCNDEYSVEVQVLKLFTGTSVMEAERIKIFSYGGKIYVDFQMKETVEARIEVFDLIGRRMHDIKTQSTGTYMIDFQTKPSACFLVKTTTLKGDVKREKVFVVNK